MPNIEIVSADVKEEPVFFDFKKNDFVGEWPGHPKPNYDPFPDKGLNDVVRSEIIARKLVLRATLKGDVFDLRPGFAVDFQGKRYAITNSTMNLLGDQEATIEAEHLLTPITPSSRLDYLHKLREGYAAENR